MVNNIIKEELEVFRTPQTSIKPQKQKSFKSFRRSKEERLKTLPSQKNSALRTRAVKQKKEIDALRMKVERIDIDRMMFAEALMAADYVDGKKRSELSSKLEEERVKFDNEKTQIAELSARHKLEIKNASLLLEEEKTKVKELSSKLEEERRKVATEKTKIAELSARHKLEVKEASLMKTEIGLQKEKIITLTNKIVVVENEKTRLGKELKTSIKTQEKQTKQIDVLNKLALEEKMRLGRKVSEMEKLSLKEKFELGTFKRKYQEETKKLAKLSAIHKSLLTKLRDKIQCPVCQVIPRAETVPVCSNGHFVCRKCKIYSCPMCSVVMGNCMSSLAVIVIENIDHKCKFDACREFFALDKLADHEQFCSHRIVQCPYLRCNEKVSLSSLLCHTVLKKCSQDGFPTKVSSDSISYIRRTFLVPTGDNDINWTSSLFSVDDNVFVVFPVKLEGVFYFSLVMFSSEAVCSKYRIEVIVHERLAVDGKSMEQIVKKGTGFSVSFSIQKK